MTAQYDWIERLAELVKDDKALHDATVKLLLAAAENEMSKSEWRRFKIK